MFEPFYFTQFEDAFLADEVELGRSFYSSHEVDAVKMVPFFTFVATYHFSVIIFIIWLLTQAV